MSIYGCLFNHFLWSKVKPSRPITTDLFLKPHLLECRRVDQIISCGSFQYQYLIFYIIRSPKADAFQEKSKAYSPNQYNLEVESWNFDVEKSASVHNLTDLKMYNIQFLMTNGLLFIKNLH